MKKTILAAASGIALTAGTPALAAEMPQDAAVETVAVEMSEERRALALAAVDAYWPMGLTGFTTDYMLHTFADEMLYTPIGELVERYGLIEMAGDIAAMIEELEAMDEEVGDEDGEEVEEESTGIELTPEQQMKGMVAMFEDQRLIDIISAQDEHFEERLSIVREVVAEELPGYSAAVEPKMRDMFAEMFARRFTDAELRDLAAFATTSTGQKYAREQWIMFIDPAYVKAIFVGIPESVELMEAMFTKMEERMEHLPPMFGSEIEEVEAIEEATEEDEVTAEELIAQAEELEAEAQMLMEEAAELRAQAAELE